jgi:hypothetical protein
VLAMLEPLLSDEQIALLAQDARETTGPTCEQDE